MGHFCQYWDKFYLDFYSYCCYIEYRNKNSNKKRNQHLTNRILVSYVHMYLPKSIVPQISSYPQAELLFVKVSLLLFT